MKRNITFLGLAVFIGLVVLIGLARPASADLLNLMVQGNWEEVQAWGNSHGLTDEAAKALESGISQHGKAKEEVCEARAKALIAFLSRDPEAFLADPKAHFEQALTLVDVGFESPASAPSAPKSKSTSEGCSDLLKVQEAGDGFAAGMKILPSFFLPQKAKTLLVKLGLSTWAMDLKSGLHAPCVPSKHPGLFEDFEVGARAYDYGDYADKSGSVATRVIQDPTDPRNHVLSFNGAMKGWGCGVYFQSNYALPSYAGKTKLRFRIKTASDLTLYPKLYENSLAPGGDEKWGAKDPLLVKASPEWQTLEISLAALVKEKGYESTQGPSFKGNDKLDLDKIHRFELFVNKASTEEVVLELDDIEFK